MSEHSGVTGKTPHQVARADSLREITDATPEESRGRPEQLVRRELGRSGSRSDPGVPPIGAPGGGNGPG